MCASVHRPLLLSGLGSEAVHGSGGELTATFLDADRAESQTLTVLDSHKDSISADFGAVIHRFDYDQPKMLKLLLVVFILAVGSLWLVLDPRPILLRSAGTVQVVSAIGVAVFCWEIVRLTLILLRRLPVLVITTRGVIVPRPWSPLKLLGWSDIAQVSEGVMAVVINRVHGRRLLIRTTTIQGLPRYEPVSHMAERIKESQRSFGSPPA